MPLYPLTPNPRSPPERGYWSADGGGATRPRHPHHRIPSPHAGRGQEEGPYTASLYDRRNNLPSKSRDIFVTTRACTPTLSFGVVENLVISFLHNEREEYSSSL